ncbi:MAG: UDP-N-acetylglucosamine--N-acetylmuramyl-(pentapeptide) pyrophosphoryl-undecaprenol N-acetylglucosamine transferase [Verrucomicrobia bacterium]|nr:MAG: UDP-N-acetylglucosamine--N-acetylmuramyl-(pentapeptide) pyrophosphoryl-undecaprenol N-acetylglucosamine transferase [Verrucomicrobiota bacterium]
MSGARATGPLVVIACGGTGGHLYPGLAVAAELEKAGARTVCVVSDKPVDQEAVKRLPKERVMTLPSAGWRLRRAHRFALGLARSWRRLGARFAFDPPAAVLGMGGFTSVAPVLWARWRRVPVFLHEANAVPGRAVRRLGRWAREVFVHFPPCVEALSGRRVRVTGMPVREGFRGRDPSACRRALGLDPERPVLAVMGGSQGARALNQAMVSAVSLWRLLAPGLQVVHLTGPADADEVRRRYAAAGVPGWVAGRTDRMPEVLGAATAALSRAGASSIAELAAARVPALLVPYPYAVDDHQTANARCLAEAGGARWIPQNVLERPEKWVEVLRPLLVDARVRSRMQEALARWDRPEAARRVAERIRQSVDPAWTPAAGIQPAVVSPLS